jgi:hypothetical protein
LRLGGEGIVSFSLGAPKHIEFVDGGANLLVVRVLRIMSSYQTVAAFRLGLPKAAEMDSSGHTCDYTVWLTL